MSYKKLELQELVYSGEFSKARELSDLVENSRVKEMAQRGLQIRENIYNQYSGLKNLDLSSLRDEFKQTFNHARELNSKEIIELSSHLKRKSNCPDKLTQTKRKVYYGQLNEQVESLYNKLNAAQREAKQADIAKEDFAKILYLVCYNDDLDPSLSKRSSKEIYQVHKRVSKIQNLFDDSRENEEGYTTDKFLKKFYFKDCYSPDVTVSKIEPNLSALQTSIEEMFMPNNESEPIKKDEKNEENYLLNKIKGTISDVGSGFKEKIRGIKQYFSRMDDKRRENMKLLAPAGIGACLIAVVMALMINYNSNHVKTTYANDAVRQNSGKPTQLMVKKRQSGRLAGFDYIFEEKELGNYKTWWGKTKEKVNSFIGDGLDPRFGPDNHVGNAKKVLETKLGYDFPNPYFQNSKLPTLVGVEKVSN